MIPPARLLLAGGASSVAMGIGLFVPAFIERLERGPMPRQAVFVVSVAGALVACGTLAILAGARRSGGLAMPPAVRAVLSAQVLFLAFCALETSDGLLRQQGRVFYWTSLLFAPALLLLAGVVFARRWAWWAARGVTAVFVLWFAVFLVLIPFADLRGSGGPVPLSGRLYMAGVTLVFAAIAAYAFRALGRREARDYFAK